MDTIFNQNLGILTLLLAILAFGLGAYNLWQTRKNNALRKIFFAGKNGSDLENVLTALVEKVRTLENENLAASEEIFKLKQTLNFAVQKLGLIKYSPFAEKDGGSYSFSLALLDAHNTGIIITNMYGRQQSRVYTKSLKEGKSESPLTEEEAQAVVAANSKS